VFTEMRVTEFLDVLASKESVPGGGSGAALAGAQAAALVSMVCNLTIGKKGYEQVAGPMTDLLAKSEALRRELPQLLEADTQVYAQVMAAYRLPRTSDEERATRGTAMQRALKEAADVPLTIADRCSQVIDLALPAAEMGNPWAVSDAGVAVTQAVAEVDPAAAPLAAADTPGGLAPPGGMTRLLSGWLPRGTTIFDLSPPPAPAAVAGAAPLPADELADVDLALSLAVTGPSEQWPLEPLRDRLRLAASRATTGDERTRAEAIDARLARFEAIKARQVALAAPAEADPSPLRLGSMWSSLSAVGSRPVRRWPARLDAAGPNGDDRPAGHGDLAAARRSPLGGRGQQQRRARVRDAPAGREPRPVGGSAGDRPRRAGLHAGIQAALSGRLGGLAADRLRPAARDRRRHHAVAARRKRSTKVAGLEGWPSQASVQAVGRTCSLRCPDPGSGRLQTRPTVVATPWGGLGVCLDVPQNTDAPLCQRRGWTRAKKP